MAILGQKSLIHVLIFYMTLIYKYCSNIPDSEWLTEILVPRPLVHPGKWKSQAGWIIIAHQPWEAGDQGSPWVEGRGLGATILASAVVISRIS